MPHRIPLRGFWEVSAADGRTHYRRAFGRPRAADPGETVWLVGDALPGPAAVVVNGTAVGQVGGGPFALDITARLKPRNEVVITANADPAGPLGAVAIEIRPAAA